MIDESNDSLEDLMSLSRQVFFDTGAARLVCPTAFRPDVPIEPSEEIPLHQADGTRVAHLGSKFLSMGVGTQKNEGRSDVEKRDKTDRCCWTAEGQWSWRGVILDVKSARKLRNCWETNVFH